MGDAQPFEVRVERLEDAVVLEFVGELDLTAAEEAATALADAVCDIPRMIVVNLEGLSFMDSTGLHCLVRAKALADAVGTRLAIRLWPRSPAALVDGHGGPDPDGR
jgi:anti-sigma B factor antagonist